MDSNKVSQRVPKSKEEKEAFKALKKLEKEKRKEKSILKDSSQPNENDLVKSIEKVSVSTISSEQPKKKTRVKSSDMVSFSESQKSPSLNIDSVKICMVFDRPQEKFKCIYFNHLCCPDKSINISNIINKIPDDIIHPEMKKLGLLLDSYQIRGSTLRCQKFLEALKQMVVDHKVTNNECFSKSFSNSFDCCVDFLDKCRPLSVTMRTAIDFLKMNLSVLNESDQEKSRKIIIEMIDQFLVERIDFAHTFIQTLTSDYIKKMSNVLICSHSQLGFKSILHTWEEIKLQKFLKFRVIVVDVFPDSNGQKMVDLLKDHNVPYTMIDLAHVSHVMKTVDVVILGAHSVLSNGAVVSCSGAASVAETAKLFSKEVIVCVETFKFNVARQHDSFEFNEMGNPDAVVEKLVEIENVMPKERVKNWRKSKFNITIVDPFYDVIPRDLIRGVLCEFGIISPVAVSLVSQIKQPY